MLANTNDVWNNNNSDTVSSSPISSPATSTATPATTGTSANNADAVVIISTTTSSSLCSSSSFYSDTTVDLNSSFSSIGSATESGSLTPTSSPLRRQLNACPSNACSSRILAKRKAFVRFKRSQLRKQTRLLAHRHCELFYCTYKLGNRRYGLSIDDSGEDSRDSGCGESTLPLPTTASSDVNVIGTSITGDDVKVGTSLSSEDIVHKSVNITTLLLACNENATTNHNDNDKILSTSYIKDLNAFIQSKPQSLIQYLRDCSPDPKDFTAFNNAVTDLYDANPNPPKSGVRVDWFIPDCTKLLESYKNETVKEPVKPTQSETEEDDFDDEASTESPTPEESPVKPVKIPNGKATNVKGLKVFIPEYLQIDPDSIRMQVGNTVSAAKVKAQSNAVPKADMTAQSTPVIKAQPSATEIIDGQISKKALPAIPKPTKIFNDTMRAEASVVQRITELQNEGMIFYDRRLPRLHEPPRIKSHWDYLLEEMQWLAADFTQERKWKRIAARKCAKMVEKYFHDKESALRRAKREEQLRVQKIAAFIAKEVRNFWSNAQKLIEYKEQSRIEELKKKALDQHLSYIVDQTEKFSSMLASSFQLEENTRREITDDRKIILDAKESEAYSDDDFEPPQESDDDEETIEKAEKQELNNKSDIDKEISHLKSEADLPLEDLLAELPVSYFEYKGEDPEEEDDDSRSTESSDDEECDGEDDENEDEEEAMDVDDDDDDAQDTLSEESSDESTVGEPEDEQTLGLASLLQSFAPEKAGESTADEDLNSVAALAESFQPKGYTLSSTNVVTKVPVLLKHTLREYQHIGLDWLVTMYEKKLNGILADEMGLGKTIQTIALLAHLACEKGSWGPHLIIVPTSVMLNWEMEFKKWCPGFKVLTYYGSVKERKLKRQGWTRPNAFHVCITSYKLVIQDHQSFRRKRWRYLILDEAQNIKNFKSQRWQLLLNFASQRRLLLTGTPLQNNLMELWSLMHFLMPNVFQSHREFREWFSNPVTGMVEGSSEYNENIIRRLHKVLRPFILRRLKTEVEKQLPQKYEHVVMCRLSKRQRYLYEEFMSRTRTRETLASGNLLSVINVLMQLRKVCNHPNLFETRPIISPLQTEGMTLVIPSLVWNLLENLKDGVNYPLAKPTEFHFMLGEWLARKLQEMAPPLTEVTVNLSLDGLEGNVKERNVDSRENFGDTNDPSKALPTTKKIVFTWRKALKPIPPRSKTKIPLFFSIKDTRPFFHEELYLKSLFADASLPETFQPGNGPYKRKLEDETPYCSKISKLSTGQVQVIRTPAGHHQVVIADANCANTLQPDIVDGKDSVCYEPPIDINPDPLTYYSEMSGTSVINDSCDGVVLYQEIDGKLQECPPPPRKRYAVNPALKMNLDFENSLGSRVQHAKLSGDEESDEYEDSEEEFTRPPMKVDIYATRNDDTKKPGESKREFRLEDAFEDYGYRKRKFARKGNPFGGSVWLRINGYHHQHFETAELENRRLLERKAVIERLGKLNTRRCKVNPFYGYDTVRACSAFDVPISRKSFRHMFFTRRRFSEYGYFNLGYAEIHSYRLSQASDSNWSKNHPAYKWRYSKPFIDLIATSERAISDAIHSVLPSILYIPSVATPPFQCRVFKPAASSYHHMQAEKLELTEKLKSSFDILHPITTRMATQFPDPRLIQYDCGKLQQLDRLLRRLFSEDHRVLIFTQMTKMLDVLETFLNYHGYIYLRLDGSTKIDQRQLLMEKFNTDKRIFCFILSTRSGGIGVNLTGADTVIFYDSDWNPTMDAQAQDRCHRIGQTRDVHIYRLVSEKTVEENILLKSNQKRLLGELAIEGGNFTTAYFRKHTIRDLFDVDELADEQPKALVAKIKTENEKGKDDVNEKNRSLILESALTAAEDDTDIQAARTVRAEAAAELAEFDESIPLDELGEGRDFEEPSRIALEMALIEKELTSVERYALRFMESTINDWTTETYASAQKEIEEQKRQWELEQMKRQEQASSHDSDMSDDEVIFYSSQDAQNKVNKTKKQGGGRVKSANDVSRDKPITKSIKTTKKPLRRNTHHGKATPKDTRESNNPSTSDIGKQLVLYKGQSGASSTQLALPEGSEGQSGEDKQLVLYKGSSSDSDKRVVPFQNSSDANKQLVVYEEKAQNMKKRLSVFQEIDDLIKQGKNFEHLIRANDRWDDNSDSRSDNDTPLLAIESQPKVFLAIEGPREVPAAAVQTSAPPVAERRSTRVRRPSLDPMFVTLPSRKCSRSSSGMETLSEKPENNGTTTSNSATNTNNKSVSQKVWISQGTDGDQMMPLWEPPTPPTDESDVYIDACHQLLYDEGLILEHQLPAVYVPPLKKKKQSVSPKGGSNNAMYLQTSSATSVEVSPDHKKQPLKIHRREEPIFAPRSLFDRPTPAVAKLRRDYRLQKYNNRPLSVATSPVPKAAIAPGVTIPTAPQPSTGTISTVSKPAGQAPSELPDWMTSEEFTMLQGVTNILELPLNLMVVSLAQTPNWEFLSEVVNMNSVVYRSAKQCKIRYESVIGPREEGKVIFDSPALMKKKKSKTFIKIGPPSPQRPRPQIKTAQLMIQDNNSKFTEIFTNRFDTIKNLSTKKAVIVKQPSSQKVGKQAHIFADHGINYDAPMSAQTIAQARLERLQLERRKALAAQEASRAAVQAPIGTITLSSGQTLAVQAGVQQPTNSVVLQTIPQKLTPMQIEMLKQNIMSAQLRHSVAAGQAAATRVPYQRPGIEGVSLQNVKRIQLVPNSIQSSLGAVTFAISSPAATSTVQQPIITLSSPQQQLMPHQSQVSVQRAPLVQQTPIMTVSTTTALGALATVLTPSSVRQIQTAGIMPLAATAAGQPLRVQRPTEPALALQGVKRFQLGPSSTQPNLAVPSTAGVSTMTTSLIPSLSSRTLPNVLTMSGMSSPSQPGNTHRVTFVQQSPLMTVATTTPLGTVVTTTNLQKQVQVQAASVPTTPSAILRPQQSGAESLSIQNIKRLQLVQNASMSQIVTGVSVNSSLSSPTQLTTNTVQHSLIALNSPIAPQTSLSPQRVSLVQQAPVMTVSTTTPLGTVATVVTPASMRQVQGGITALGTATVKGQGMETLSLQNLKRLQVFPTNVPGGASSVSSTGSTTPISANVITLNSPMSTQLPGSTHRQSSGVSVSTTPLGTTMVAPTSVRQVQGGITLGAATAATTFRAQRTIDPVVLQNIKRLQLVSSSGQPVLSSISTSTSPAIATQQPMLTLNPPMAVSMSSQGAAGSTARVALVSQSSLTSSTTVTSTGQIATVVTSGPRQIQGGPTTVMRPQRHTDPISVQSLNRFQMVSTSVPTPQILTTAISSTPTFPTSTITNTTTLTTNALPSSMVTVASPAVTSQSSNNGQRVSGIIYFSLPTTRGS